jgi:molybdopterin-guanine dinucleotide biosynthesis protein A
LWSFSVSQYRLNLPVYSTCYQDAHVVQNFYASVVPAIVARGLQVAVVLAESSDSGCLNPRISPACNVPVPVQCVTTFSNYSYSGPAECAVPSLIRLLRDFDIIFVDGCRDPQLTRVMLQADTIDEVHDLHLGDFVQTPEGAVQGIIEDVKTKLAARPVWACILIGGKSSRMGQPKHLLAGRSGRSWLEGMVETVQPHVTGVALSGNGDVPKSLTSYVRLPDIPGVAGPLTGLLAAMRWQPDVSWLLLACDMPEVTTESIGWLLAQASPGSWGSVPAIGGKRGVEPLFARYEPQAAAIFEQLALAGVRRISRIAESDRIKVVQVPEYLQRAWRNVNTPEDLQSLNL